MPKSRRPLRGSLAGEGCLPSHARGWLRLGKALSEGMCRHFREDFGLATRVARYHNLCGPHDTCEGGRENAPAAMCRKVLQAKASGRCTIEICGDGRQTRSFTYSDDCVKGTLARTDSDILKPINLGSSELVTVNQLVDIAEEIAAVRLERGHNLTAPKGVNGRNSGNTRIKAALGWEPSIRLH